jgi:hypothetical protein
MNTKEEILRAARILAILVDIEKYGLSLEVRPVNTGWEATLRTPGGNAFVNHRAASPQEAIVGVASEQEGDES